MLSMTLLSFLMESKVFRNSAEIPKQIVTKEIDSVLTIKIVYSDLNRVPCGATAPSLEITQRDRMYVEAEP
jgi:hypothetical protein